MVDYSDRRCDACGRPLVGREGKRSCSGRCRAALSRRKKSQDLQERERRVQGLLEEAVRLLAGGGEDST